VRRITTVELQDLISKGQAYVVDVRNEESYKLGHVRGAKLIPNTQIGERSKELPRDKTIVTYCS
jgi:rhodanese-related sulfurtransferase